VKLRELLRDRGPMNERRALSCLAANLLVLPGLGTLVAGRRSGLAQTALALIGFALTLLWLTYFVMTWIRERAFPFAGGPHLLWGFLGVVVFGAAWLWSLVTGLAMVKEIRRRAR
jgi:hypothetical protein